MNLKKSIISLLTLGALTLPIKSNGQSFNDSTGITPGIHFYSSWKNKNGDKKMQKDEITGLDKENYYLGETLKFFIHGIDLTESRVFVFLDNLDGEERQYLGEIYYHRDSLNQYQVPIRENRSSGDYSLYFLFKNKFKEPDGKYSEIKGGKKLHIFSENESDGKTYSFLYTHFYDRNYNEELDSDDGFYGLGQWVFQKGDDINFGLVTHDPFAIDSSYTVLLRNEDHDFVIHREYINSDNGKNFKHYSINSSNLQDGDYKIIFRFGRLHKEYSAEFRIITPLNDDF